MGSRERATNSSAKEIKREQIRQKIAVAGATGRVGRHVVDILNKAGGHDVVAMSRSGGVDVVTGDGLAEALIGVACITVHIREVAGKQGIKRISVSKRSNILLYIKWTG